MRWKDSLRNLLRVQVKYVVFTFPLLSLWLPTEGKGDIEPRTILDLRDESQTSLRPAYANACHSPPGKSTDIWMDQKAGNTFFLSAKEKNFFSSTPQKISSNSLGASLLKDRSDKNNSLYKDEPSIEFDDMSVMAGGLLHSAAKFSYRLYEHRNLIANVLSNSPLYLVPIQHGFYKGVGFLFNHPGLVSIGIGGAIASYGLYRYYENPITEKTSKVLNKYYQLTQRSLEDYSFKDIFTGLIQSAAFRNLALNTALNFLYDPIFNRFPSTWWMNVIRITTTTMFTTVIMQIPLMRLLDKLSLKLTSLAVKNFFLTVEGEELLEGEG